jgi:hypothetical protein
MSAAKRDVTLSALQGVQRVIFSRQIPQVAWN